MAGKLVLLLTAILMVFISCSGRESSETRDEDLFVVVLNPAHGGKDTGAFNDSGSEEKDLVLLLADCIRNNCSGNGIKFEILRTEDVEMTLDKRLERISEIEPDLLLSLHTDSSTDTSARGIRMFHRKGDSLGIKLCSSFKSKFAAINALNDISYGEAGFRLLENSPVPAVVMEFGNINSSQDMKLVNSDRGRKELGSAVFAAIEEYRGAVAGKKK
ncbi:MAG: N-acetylmuramoyl-L-alanine amidase [Candidatus Krumholzibacteriales bacterium]